VLAPNTTAALIVSVIGVGYGALVFYFGTKYTARTFMSRERR
jgi:hypothetical protein